MGERGWGGDGGRVGREVGEGRGREVRGGDRRGGEGRGGGGQGRGCRGGDAWEGEG